MRLLQRVTILMTIAGVIFFTSSFDVLLSFNIGPNIRIAQFFILILLLAALLLHKGGLAMKIPLGGLSLLAWWLVQLAFIPAVSFWQKSLGYCIWLGLNIAIIFAMANLFGTSRAYLKWLIQIYLCSFVFAACFGILQFILPLLGGPALLVQQWWVPGLVARVNGFSYEPSYYATYLIMGIVTVGSLRRSRAKEYAGIEWRFAYWIMVLAVVLSSSRIGLMFVILDAATQPLMIVVRIIRSPWTALRFRISSLRIVGALLVLLALGFAVHEAIDWSRSNMATIEVLAGGTGLMGTSSYSVDERGNHLQDTLRVIRDHPLMGRSLGGITESIASYSGVRPTTFEQAKEYEGQSVFAEAVAASGIPGCIPFFCFVAVTILSPLKLARRVNLLSAAWLHALVRALVFEWAILQLNQNILRLYLWVHLAVLLTVFAGVKSEADQDNRLALRPMQSEATPMSA